MENSNIQLGYGESWERPLSCGGLKITDNYIQYLNCGPQDTLQMQATFAGSGGCVPENTTKH